jgi:HPt (histidine-containing phosphotransfer) domain-containing protein
VSARVELLAWFEGDAALLAELVGAFQAEAPAALGRLRHALAGGDAAGLREAAHKIRGALGTFGPAAEEAAAAARRVEERAAAGDLAAAGVALTLLECAVGRLDAALADARAVP